MVNYGATSTVPEIRSPGAPWRQHMDDSPVSPTSPRPDSFCVRSWTAVGQSAPVMALQGAFQRVGSCLGAAAAWCPSPKPFAMAVIGVSIGAIGISGAVTGLVKLGLGAGVVLIPCALLSAVAASVFIGAALIWNRPDAVSATDLASGADGLPNPMPEFDTQVAEKLDALTPLEVARFVNASASAEEVKAWVDDARRLASSPKPANKWLAIRILETVGPALLHCALAQDGNAIAYELALSRMPRAADASYDVERSRDTIAEVGRRAVAFYALPAPCAFDADIDAEAVRVKIAAQLKSMDFTSPANELNILSLLLDIIGFYRDIDARACEMSEDIERMAKTLSARDDVVYEAALIAAIAEVQHIVHTAQKATSTWENAIEF